MSPNRELFHNFSEQPVQGPRAAEVGGRSILAVLSAGVFLTCSDVGEVHASLGIDVQSVDAAPAHELIRADYCPDNPVALRSKLVLEAFGLLKPNSEFAWKDVTVFHDGLDPVVIGRVIPGYADDARQA